MSNKEKYVRCTTLEFDRWRLHNPVIPYSLLVASTDLLPAAGDTFSTKSYIPFAFHVTNISFQTTQEIFCPVKVKVNIVGNQSFEVFITPKTPTYTVNTNIKLSPGKYTNIIVENLKEENSIHDLGDISSFILHFHGYVM